MNPEGALNAHVPRVPADLPAPAPAPGRPRRNRRGVWPDRGPHCRGDRRRSWHRRHRHRNRIHRNREGLLTGCVKANGTGPGVAWAVSAGHLDWSLHVQRFHILPELAHQAAAPGRAGRDGGGVWPDRGLDRGGTRLRAQSVGSSDHHLVHQNWRRLLSRWAGRGGEPSAPPARGCEEGQSTKRQRPGCVGVRDRGAAAVEFALCLPILLLLVFGIIDFGRALNAQITLTQAAREGVRLAALGYTSAAVQARAQTAAPELSGISVTIAASCPPGAGPTADAEVNVSYSFTFVTPV